jgi:MoxR-like ATPase
MAKKKVSKQETEVVEQAIEESGIDLGDKVTLDNEGLTPKERFYLSTMKGTVHGGVLYIRGRPGVAKSAIARSIAKKLGYRYFDVRLSQIDSTDLGFPRITTKKYDGKEYEVMTTALPEWALEANLSPCIIHFEELNRAQLDVRNAALQILNERQIGVNFKFNDHVLMIASGNLGDDDGTDVEEFDEALNGRLIHYNHDLTINEWIDGYAKENVHDIIVRYLQTPGGSAHFYKIDKMSDKDKSKLGSYASPRSWTFLSDYIQTTYGKNADSSQWIHDIEKHGISFIGSSVVKFVRYIRDSMVLTINDILNRYPDVQLDLQKFDRSKKSELIVDLQKVDISKMSIKQVDNIVDFLEQCCEQDEIAGFVSSKMDERKEGKIELEKMTSSKPIMHFLNRLHKYSYILDNLYKAPDNGKTKK